MGFSKSKGGLGFRDLYGFNIALLGKHCWNFMCNPTSFVSRLFKARYFSSSHVLKANRGRVVALSGMGFGQRKRSSVKDLGGL